MEQLGRILIVCGPSGSGKSTLIKRILLNYPNKFQFCISHTTRQPRQNEINGIHYHFINKETFLLKVDHNDFLEYTNYNGNNYGTSKEAIKVITEEGKVCLLDVDIEGVKKIKHSVLNPVMVFITPPNIKELEKRLQSRATETKVILKSRLKIAEKEIKYATTSNNFHKIIVNDDLNQAYNELEEFLIQNVIKNNQCKCASV